VRRKGYFDCVFVVPTVRTFKVNDSSPWFGIHPERALITVALTSLRALSALSAFTVEYKSPTANRLSSIEEILELHKFRRLI